MEEKLNNLVVEICEKIIAKMSSDRNIVHEDAEMINALANLIAARALSRGK